MPHADAVTTESNPLGFRIAFQWVMNEVEMDAALRPIFFRAAEFAQSRDPGEATRLLLAAWPAHARWPSGERYLRECECEREALAVAGSLPVDGPCTRDLLALLQQRLSHVTHRVACNARIFGLLRDGVTRTRYSQILMNRFPDAAHALCGRGTHVRLSIAEGVALMGQLACPHPACRCTFEPVAPMASIAPMAPVMPQPAAGRTKAQAAR